MIEVVEPTTLRRDVAMSFRPLVVVKSKMGEFEALRHLVDRGVATPRVIVELLDSVQLEGRGQLLPSLVKVAVQMAVRQQPLWIDSHLLSPTAAITRHPSSSFEHLDNRIESALFVPNYVIAMRRQPARDTGKVVPGAAAEAFSELAGELVARPEFAGSTFSWGDGELARCRRVHGRTASTVSRWVAYATSHHLEHLAQRATSGL